MLKKDLSTILINYPSQPQDFPEPVLIALRTFYKADCASIGEPATESEEDDSSESEDDNSPEFEAQDASEIEPEGNTETICTEDALSDSQELIRVGRQPIIAHGCVVHTAPRRQAVKLVKYRIRNVYKSVDRELATISWTKLDDNAALMQQYLLSSFQVRSNGGLSRRCDYTGLPLLWTSGPMSFSLEAVYPYASNDGQLGYHMPANVAFIMSFLNFAKKNFPALVLPLAGAWQRSLEHPDFEERRSLCAWVFNAMMNVAILHKLFGCSINNHEETSQLWSSWDSDKQRAVLECLRTGYFNQAFLSFFTGVSNEDLLCFDIGGRERTLGLQLPGSAFIYRNMVRIAARYGISEPDFEYYFTLPTPDGTNRVFYPYHILSRPRAKAFF